MKELIKKCNRLSLRSCDRVGQYLKDGEEVLFEIESKNMWVKVIFRLIGADEIKVYGSQEMLVDKRETMWSFKNKL